MRSFVDCRLVTGCGELPDASRVVTERLVVDVPGPRTVSVGDAWSLRLSASAGDIESVVNVLKVSMPSWLSLVMVIQ